MMDMVDEDTELPAGTVVGIGVGSRDAAIGAVGSLEQTLEWVDRTEVDVVGSLADRLLLLHRYEVAYKSDREQDI